MPDLSVARRTRGILLAAAAVLASTATPAQFAGTAYGESPVVVRASLLPGVESLAIPETAFVAFRYEGDGFAPFPVQVDGYFTTPVCDDPANAVCEPTERRVGLDGAPDPDPTIDVDDEVVFLAKEAGPDRAPEGRHPAGVRASTRYELAVHDPAMARVGHVYLYAAEDGGASRPSYYLAKQTVTGRLLPPDADQFGSCTGDGPHQYTHFASSSYCAHYADRWSLDDLVTGSDGCADRSKPASAPGEVFAATCMGSLAECDGDLLDRFKGHEGLPGADPDTAFWGKCSTLIGEKVGPVRYVRATLGAKSAVTTTVFTFFYPAMFEVETRLRVHAMPGIARQFDWNGRAAGASLYHEDSLGRVSGSDVVSGDGDTGTLPSYDPDRPVESTTDVRAAGASFWDYLTAGTGRVHVSWIVPSDPTRFTTFFRHAYADATPGVNAAFDNWEEHDGSLGSSGLYFDLPEATYADPFVTRVVVRVLPPDGSHPDAIRMEQGREFHDVDRDGLIVEVLDGAPPAAPPAPTDLEVVH